MADCIIPEGYKETSLGVIPKEWEVKRLGDLVSIMSGESPSLYTLHNQGKYPYVKVEDMNLCEKYQTHSRSYSNEEKNIVKKGSIIFPKRGAAILNNKVRIANVDIQMDSNMMAIFPIKDNLLEEYLYYSIVFEQLFKIADTSTIPQINNKHIIPCKILLPPLYEQQKIAEILNVWDEAIKKQTRLIEKLELRKKGLMQQLLTGKKRLPGFSGEWKKIAIKDFAIEISLKNNRNENWEVLSCTKYDGLVPSLQYFGRQVFSKDITQYKIVPQYCFAYATNHIEEGSIGYQSTYRNALISPMYTVFKTDSNVIDDIFLYKLLKSHHAIYLYNVMMEGSIDRRGGLRWDNFSTIKFLLPDIKEQSAIADILVSCDNEILLAKQKLNEFHQQKKGLMQVLLTGKKRVTQ